MHMPHFASGKSVVNLSFSCDRMSQLQTESYTAAKGGIAALTHALAVSLAGRARVNSISPGWIDTMNPEDIAALTLSLCSDVVSFTSGENICVDGGTTKLMIYHRGHGWKYGDYN